jgi:hypothetical protein
MHLPPTITVEPGFVIPVELPVCPLWWARHVEPFLAPIGSTLIGLGVIAAYLAR